jgi:hypothetical protein
MTNVTSSELIQNEEPSEESLLKEYEACQSHNNSLGNQAWISISIIITVNILLLGQVIYNIMLKSFPITGYANLVLVTLLGLVMIFILIIFKLWDKRIDFLTWMNYDRMREIEMRLGMWKNWRVRGLDLKYNPKLQGKWRNLNPNIKSKLNELSLHFPQYSKENKKIKNEIFEMWYKSPTTRGFWKFDNIFHILIGLWAAIVLLEWSIYFCSFIRRCLF